MLYCFSCTRVHKEGSSITHPTGEASRLAVTIKDVAKEAGVSHTTVSRALRDHPAISIKTTNRIRKIADELGYVPNTVARGLKTSRSGVLGVIVRRIVDPYFIEVLHGIEDVLQAEGYSLFLAASNKDLEREKKIIRTMSEHRVDGVIICSTQVSQGHQRQLNKLGVPSVLINNQALDDVPAPSVFHDDANGSRLSTMHLIELGHSKICYLGNDRAGKTNEDRLCGYKKALQDNDLPIRPAYIIKGENGLAEGGAMAAKQVLLLPDRPTAIICYNDMMAIGVIRTLTQAGLRIPEDCSIVGFDNIELSAFTQPPLTTFDQPKYEIGRVAAQMMLIVLEANAVKAPCAEVKVLRGELKIRSSTAPPVSKPIIR
jgi:DNA-binding LacI/PurR family transcriptional regulator